VLSGRVNAALFARVQSPSVCLMARFRVPFCDWCHKLFRALLRVLFRGAVALISVARFDNHRVRLLSHNGRSTFRPIGNRSRKIRGPFEILATRLNKAGRGGDINEAACPWRAKFSAPPEHGTSAFGAGTKLLNEGHSAAIVPNLCFFKGLDETACLCRGSHVANRQGSIVEYKGSWS
jgi:hypothetical protein